jgi:hypothetical protein
MILAIALLVSFAVVCIYILLKNKELERLISKIHINTKPILKPRKQLMASIQSTKHRIDRLEDHIITHKGGKV